VSVAAVRLIQTAASSAGVQASTSGKALPSRGGVGFRVLSYNTLAEKLVRRGPGMNTFVGAATTAALWQTAPAPPL